MIISKKKFNEAITQVRLEDRDKYNKRTNEDWERKQRNRLFGDMQGQISENRKNLIDVTKELNDIVAYLCDKDPVFAQKKLEEIKCKSSAYNKRKPFAPYVEPLVDDCMIDPDEP